MTLTALPTTMAWPLDSGPDENGHLQIGGCDAVELAREFGTPAYVVAENEVRRRAREYVDAFHRADYANFKILFASKAFPCAAIYRVLHEEGLSCDAASAGELSLALGGGMDAADICLHGNAKTDEELLYAMDRGVGYVVIDSFDEIDRLSRLVKASQDVLIRVTPNVRPTKLDAISTGQEDSKFGFILDDAPRAIERVRASKCLRLRGLHVHIGSQIFDLSHFDRAIEAIAPLGDFEIYNLGGGLGVAYDDSDDESPRSIAEYVERKIEAVRRCLGSDKRILIEPGRSITANAGVTLYSVISIKKNVSTYVAVDGGMSDNLRPMLYKARYQAVIANRFGAIPDTACKVVGKHCESGDVLVEQAMLSAPKVDDILATPVTGAYGHSMANNYNAMLRPPVIFCKDGNAELVVRRENFEDLAAREVL